MAKKATKKKPATKRRAGLSTPGAPTITEVRAESIPSLDAIPAWRASCALCEWSYTFTTNYQDAGSALVAHCLADHADESMNGTVGLVTL